jgi:microsomal epoxide hydrolase
MLRCESELCPEDPALKRFTIEVPDAVLDDLKQRLARTRLPDQLEGAGWDYGTELSYLKELVGYWKDKYDWRVHERALNEFEHWKTTVRDLEVHFIHQRSPEQDALPLVITHGWPGSVYEFHKIIGPLTNPVAHGGRREDAFHVVCPSMPGYGWSQAPKKPGFDITAVAETNAALMAKLGYTRYGAQGGDWGAIATAWLGRVDPSHLAGIHMNMVVAGPPPGVANPMEGVTAEEQAWLGEMGEFQQKETGYQQIQGTKPQTLGYGLNDSPAGLAAWIVEKFRAWSDCGGDVESAFTRDRLLTNIAVYWFNGTITSSTRLYYEVMRSPRLGLFTSQVQVPTGVARFPKEIMRFPRRWVEQRYRVTHWSDQPRGGHFAAMEQPQLYVEDVRKFFRSVR